MVSPWQCKNAMYLPREDGHLGPLFRTFDSERNVMGADIFAAIQSVTASSTDRLGASLGEDSPSQARIPIP